MIVVLALVVIPTSTSPLKPVAAQDLEQQSMESQLSQDYVNHYYDYMAQNCPSGGCDQAAMDDMVWYALASSGVTTYSEQLLFFDPTTDCLRSCINSGNSQCQAAYNAAVIEAGSKAVAAAVACAAVAGATPLTLSLCLAAVTIIYLGTVASLQTKLDACKAKVEFDCREKCQPVGGTCTPSPYIVSWCSDYNFATCTCDGTIDKSPVIIDVAGDGLALTSPETGVMFDIAVNGSPLRLSWTQTGSDDSFLVLDLNRNGIIDNGEELFGNFTPQPIPGYGERRNGFLALAEYDRPPLGGNADGQIDSRDVIFYSLQLWRDENHNGVSEPSELKPLTSSGIEVLSLRYEEAGRRDRYGNQFRCRAKVSNAKDLKVGRWAWDVFLQEAK